MHVRFNITLIALLAAVIAGCAPESLPAPTGAALPATATSTTSRNVTPEPTLEVVPTIGTKTPRPTLALTATPVTLPPGDLAAGLVFSTGEGLGEASLLLMGADHTLQPLADVDGLPTETRATILSFVVSPDGKSALYVAHDDIWQLDATGITTNLTNTPDVSEINPKWWGSERFVFYVLEDNAGTLAVHAHGPEGRREIIAADTYDVSVGFAPAPDGERILIEVPVHVQFAGDQGYELWMYQRSGAMERLDLAALEPKPAIYGGNFSWSPDGSKLVGMVGIARSDNGLESVFAILDLDARTSQEAARLPIEEGHHDLLQHSDLRWSPDGSWFVFFYKDAPLEAHVNGVWVGKGTGEARHIETPDLWESPGMTDAHSQPYISPDGKWVIIDTGNNGQKLLFRTDTWEPIVWWLPGMTIEGWMALP
jgi:hypothetical protein